MADMLTRIRQAAAGYAPGQGRPLRGYLATLGAYAGLAGGLVGLARLTGRRAPDRLSTQDVVLTADDHDYERFAAQDPNGRLDLANGITEFVVGTGGRSHYAFPVGVPAPSSQVRNDDTFGVIKLALHPGGYDWNTNQVVLYNPGVGPYAPAAAGGDDIANFHCGMLSGDE